MKRIRFSLYVLTIVNIAATQLLLHDTEPPYTTIGLVLLLLADLIIRAPLKYRAAEICNAKCQAEGERGTRKKRIPALRDAVTLQIWLWKSRVWRYTLAFLPSICLAVLSERTHSLYRIANDPQVLSAVIMILSYFSLILGIMLAEFFMFRYMAVWYLLPLCSSTKQAIRCARSLSLYRMDEMAELCLHTFPFSDARAVWTMCELKRSKHTYNFFENTKTVSGTLDA